MYACEASEGPPLGARWHGETVTEGVGSGFFVFICKLFVNFPPVTVQPIDIAGCLEYILSSRTNRVLKIK